MSTGVRGHIRKNSSHGSIAMFIVVFLTILASIPLGMSLLQVSNQRTTQQINVTVQSDNVARAGLVEAVSWFRRQATQPVRSSVDPVTYPYADAAFFPRASTTTTTDTIDESIGLVKEYVLNESNSLWARYEVRRQADTATNPVDSRAVHDISASRVEGASAGDGLAWYIESTGIVFRRRDSGVAYDVSPNEVVSRSRVATEIRRISITLPVNAAAIVNARNTVSVTNQAKIQGNNNTALGYYTGSSGPTTSSGGSVAGTPNITDIDGSGVSGSIQPQAVLGVTQSELKLMADYSVTNVSELPSKYPSMAVVYINGNATFNGNLTGGGILFVNGNLTIEPALTGRFSGFIFVTGNCILRGAVLVSGAIMVQGSLTMNGNGDVAEVEYDASILNSVRQQVAQYRENKATFYTLSGTK